MARVLLKFQKADIDLRGISSRSHLLKGVSEYSRNKRKESNVVNQQPGAPAFYSEIGHQLPDWVCSPNRECVGLSDC